MRQIFAASSSIWPTLVVIAGGIWAIYVWRTGRKSQVKVAIEHSWRLSRTSTPEALLLLVRLKITNTSNVLWRNEETTATLMDASALSPSGEMFLVPFARQDPFLPVYGSLATNSAEIAEGELFFYEDGQQVMLEPGESVESELAFPLDPDQLGLMALRVAAKGYQRTRQRRPYLWGSFFLIDPHALR